MLNICVTRKIKQYIKQCIKYSEFNVAYQPQFRYTDGAFRIVGAEALLRPDPRMCRVSKLIEVAKDSSLINDVGCNVLSIALQQTSEWKDQGIVDDEFTISVNICAQQLMQPNFVVMVLDSLDKTDIPPNQLIIELTETSTLTEGVVDTLVQLANIGVKLSIDDFGSGYSALGRLKQLPVHEVKVDKMFVDNVHETTEDQIIIKAIYDMCNALNLHVVIEGVETHKQFKALNKIGLDTFQGYYFSKSLNADELASLITTVNLLPSTLLAQGQV